MTGEQAEAAGRTLRRALSSVLMLVVFVTVAAGPRALLMLAGLGGAAAPVRGWTGSTRVTVGYLEFVGPSGAVAGGLVAGDDGRLFWRPEGEREFVEVAPGRTTPAPERPAGWLK